MRAWGAYSITPIEGFQSRRAPTEADARLIMNALLLPIYRWRPFPRPSLVPPWNRRSPVLRGRGFSMGKIFNPNKVQKWATCGFGQEHPCYRGLTRGAGGSETRHRQSAPLG